MVEEVSREGAIMLMPYQMKKKPLSGDMAAKVGPPPLQKTQPGLFTGEMMNTQAPLAKQALGDVTQVSGTMNTQAPLTKEVLGQGALVPGMGDMMARPVDSVPGTPTPGTPPDTPTSGPGSPGWTGLGGSGTGGGTPVAPWPPPAEPTLPNIPQPPPGGDTWGGTQQPFNPDDNLIGTQINPVGSERYGETRTLVDAARGGVAGWGGLPGFEGIGTGTYTPGADTEAAREAAAQKAAAVGGGASRGDIALEHFKTLEEASADRTKLGTQQIGRDAARLGRLGSGMVTTSLGDLSEREAIARNQALRELAAGAAEGDITDRLSSLAAAQSYYGQLGGEDRATAGVEQALRQEGRGERADEQGYSLQDLAAKQSQLGSLAGLEGQQYGQDYTGRQELRGERGYQYEADRAALGDRVNQMMLEEQMYGADYNRQMQMAQLLAQLGYDTQSINSLIFGAQVQQPQPLYGG